MARYRLLCAASGVLVFFVGVPAAVATDCCQLFEGGRQCFDTNDTPPPNRVDCLAMEDLARWETHHYCGNDGWCEVKPPPEPVVNIIPVTAIVEPQGGGAGAPQTIGNITVTTGPTTPPITAVFTFKGGFGILDEWYDFRWINVIVAKTPIENTDGDAFNEVPVPGLGNHDLPFIDPAPGQPPPAAGADNEPYYWDTPATPTGLEFDAWHVEGVSSTFADAKQLSGFGETITFKTFLVIDAGKVDPSPPANTFWVLDGFEWIYSDPVGGPRTITFVAALSPDELLIDSALNEGGPAGGLREWNANGPFKAWDAAPRAECHLEQESPCTVECRDGRGLTAMVKTSDACHELCDLVCVTNEQVLVCQYKGNPVKTTPAVSEWGMVVLVLVLLMGLTLKSRRWRLARA